MCFYTLVRLFTTPQLFMPNGNHNLTALAINTLAPASSGNNDNAGTRNHLFVTDSH